jgi:hypothetical protein
MRNQAQMSSNAEYMPYRDARLWAKPNSDRMHPTPIAVSSKKRMKK